MTEQFIQDISSDTRTKLDALHAAVYGKEELRESMNVPEGDYEVKKDDLFWACLFTQTCRPSCKAPLGIGFADNGTFRVIKKGTTSAKSASFTGGFAAYMKELVFKGTDPLETTFGHYVVNEILEQNIDETEVKEIDSTDQAVNGRAMTAINWMYQLLKSQCKDSILPLCKYMKTSKKHQGWTNPFIEYVQNDDDFEKSDPHYEVFEKPTGASEALRSPAASEDSEDDEAEGLGAPLATSSAVLKPNSDPVALKKTGQESESDQDDPKDQDFQGDEKACFSDSDDDVIPKRSKKRRKLKEAAPEVEHAAPVEAVEINFHECLQEQNYLEEFIRKVMPFPEQVAKNPVVTRDAPKIATTKQTMDFSNALSKFKAEHHQGVEDALASHADPAVIDQPLYDYQVCHVRTLLKILLSQEADTRGLAFLQTPMGGGKTRTMLYAMYAHFQVVSKEGRDGAMSAALAIVPNHIVGEWVQEASHFAKSALVAYKVQEARDLQYTVDSARRDMQDDPTVVRCIVCSYACLADHSKTRFLYRWDPSFICCDEPQSYIMHAGQRYAAAVRALGYNMPLMDDLGYQRKSTVLCSGTPFNGSAGENVVQGIFTQWGIPVTDALRNPDVAYGLCTKLSAGLEPPVPNTLGSMAAYRILVSSEATRGILAEKAAAGKSTLATGRFAHGLGMQDERVQAAVAAAKHLMLLGYGSVIFLNDKMNVQTLKLQVQQHIYSSPLHEREQSVFAFSSAMTAAEKAAETSRLEDWDSPLGPIVLMTFGMGEGTNILARPRLQQGVYGQAAAISFVMFIGVETLYTKCSQMIARVHRPPNKDPVVAVYIESDLDYTHAERCTDLREQNAQRVAAFTRIRHNVAKSKSGMEVSTPSEVFLCCLAWHAWAAKGLALHAPHKFVLDGTSQLKAPEKDQELANHRQMCLQALDTRKTHVSSMPGPAHAGLQSITSMLSENPSYGPENDAVFHNLQDEEAKLLQALQGA